MVTAVIVDDEKAGVENLRALLSKYCPAVQIIGEANSAAQAKLVCEAVQPQLVFLDIEMPFGNAFDFLSTYQQIPFEVIFVTAFEKYAMKAIRLSACDYILKPIDISELIAAVEKARERISTKVQSENLQALMVNMKNLGKDKIIAVPTIQGLIFIKTQDIVRFEADGGYTWIHFTNRDKLLVTKTLGDYDEVLSDSDFMRVHHAHLVNFQHVSEFIKGNSPVLIMSDDSSVSVSKRKKDILLERLSKIT
jgi:two-component system LytT family response regulator